MEIKLQKITVGKLKTNCYLLFYQNKCFVIDPGDESAKIISALQANNLAPNYLLATHGHFDHVRAVSAIKKAYPKNQFLLSQNGLSMLNKSGLIAPLFGCQPLLNPPKPDGFLEQLKVTGLKVIKTPGHSPGGVCFFISPKKGSPILFSGDTLFNGYAGRYDFPGGNKTQLKKSLEKLIRLPPATLVYPGHEEEFVLGQTLELLLKRLEVL
jgi:glyoxylase-like metal-dependent hydrolase (beta-lactamase superfamily II)